MMSLRQSTWTPHTQLGDMEMHRPIERRTRYGIRRALASCGVLLSLSSTSLAFSPGRAPTSTSTVGRPAFVANSWTGGKNGAAGRSTAPQGGLFMVAIEKTAAAAAGSTPGATISPPPKKSTATESSTPGSSASVSWYLKVGVLLECPCAPPSPSARSPPPPSSSSSSSSSSSFIYLFF